MKIKQINDIVKGVTGYNMELSIRSSRILIPIDSNHIDAIVDGLVEEGLTLDKRGHLYDTSNFVDLSLGGVGISIIYEKKRNIDEEISHLWREIEKLEVLKDRQINEDIQSAVE